jgi:hypothetical protein
MLAAPVGRLPEQLDGWTIEPKWDGVRVVAEVTPRGARLWTRNGNDKAPQFPEIVAALTALARAHGPFVLDGEIIALDASGRAQRFQALQGRVHAESDEAKVIRIVLNGLTGPVEVAGETYSGMMPPWGGVLKDPEIAAVLTYVRSTWGNKGAPITASKVAAIRAATASRTTPWTAAELANVK